MALQHLRSGTAHKRPIPSVMSAGQLAINTNEASPGLFFKDSNGDLVKVGPVHIGTDAPNSSPASVAATALVTGTVYQILTVGTSDFTLVGASANTVGTIFTATGTTTGTGTVSGQQGVEKGEQWLDTTGGTYVLKIYDGTAWRSESGTFVDVNGDTMTGSLILPSGTAAAPALGVGSTDNGLYSPGTDQVAVSTNGTGRLFIDASGNIGVGIASPQQFLHVHGANGRIQITSTGTGSASGDGALFGYDGTNDLFINNRESTNFKVFTAGTQALTIDSSQRVGIGTSSPDTLLDISSSDNTYVTVQSTANDKNALTYYKTGQVASSGFYVGLNASEEAMVWQTENNVIRFGTNNAERLRIDSSGNVGIGTTSPENYGSGFVTVEARGTSADGGGIFQTRSYDASVKSYYYCDSSTDTARIGTVTNHPFLFVTNTAERMRIDSSGRLLVNTSSARTNLVNGTLAAQLQVEGVNHAASSASFIRNSADANNAFLTLGKTRGTANGSNTIVQNGDGLGNLAFLGADGTNLIRAAEIYAEVDGTPGSNDMPGRLVFSTTSDGASTPTERMRITSGGNVGIGTTSPGEKLDVLGSVRAGNFTGRSDTTAMTFGLVGTDTAVVMYGTGASPASTMLFRTGTSERMRIDSSGNVGIGTTSPFSALDVAYTGSGTTIASSGTTDSTTGIRFGRGTVGIDFGVLDNGTSYLQNRSVTDFSTNYNFVVNPNGGNVGIGTTSPAQLLEIASTAPNVRLTDTVDGHSEIDGNAANLKFNADKGNAKADSNISFAVDNSERMRIDSSGNVGIGTTSPGAKLHLVNTGQATSALNTAGDLSLLVTESGTSVNNGGSIVFAAASGSWRFAAIKGLVTSGTNNTQGDLAFCTRNTNTDSTLTERMRIASSGYFYIHTTTNFPGSGNTATGAMFEKASTGTTFFVSRDSNTAAHFNRNGDGNLISMRRSGSEVGNISVTTTATAYNTSSDYRLKENVVNLDGAIDRVKQLAPKRFNFIADADTTVDGFLAHEAQTVVPEAVTGTHNEVDDDGNAVMQGIDQSKLVPLLTAALQEAIAKIETLEQRLTDAGL